MMKRPTPGLLIQTKKKFSDIAPSPKNKMNLISYLVLLVCVVYPLQSALITDIIDEKKEPSEFDILQIDLPLAMMKMKIKEVFKFVNNSKSTDHAVFPIDGVILKEPFERVVIPITVMHKKRKIKTTCVVDCVSPWTFLSQNTLADIGIEVVSDGFNLVVHGAPVTVYSSVNNFRDLNICGQSFFSEHQAELTINYRTRKAIVKKDE